MAYEKQTWVDGASGGTPINSIRLNHMEDGIYNSYNDVTEQLWEGSETISGTTTINLTTGNVYDYRFIVFDAQYGSNILVPVIQGQTYLFGSMGLITGAGQYVTNAITAYADNNGDSIRISQLKSLTHTASSNHGALSNGTLVGIYGIK